MTLKKYDLKLPPKVTNPVVFSSPHSGCLYPDAFLQGAALTRKQLRSSEDAFVDALFADVVGYGSPFLQAHAPRSYVDLNRGPDEFDPAIVDGAKNPFNNPRIASGLGVIPRVVAHGQQIQNGKLSMADAQARIDAYYHPYHKLLAELLAQSKLKFGIALLIDCHSMPSDSLQNAMAPGGARPDMILGNWFGASAGTEVFAIVEAAFKHQGFIVGRNTPFAGGYITQKYGVPSRGQHVVQVEINRGLYMDEAAIERNTHFADIQRRLVKASHDICHKIMPKSQMAAE